MDTIIKESESKKHKLRTAVYCRFSPDSEVQERSFESQVIYYTDYIADKEDWVLAGIYADSIVSCTGRRNRQELDKMLYECLHGKIDQIITKSMSCFARNQLDIYDILRLLNGLHPPVKVIFEDDHVSTDAFSAEIIVSISSMLAEQESTKKSNRIKGGFNRRLEQGHHLAPTK